jgi:hypothetical protein
MYSQRRECSLPADCGYMSNPFMMWLNTTGAFTIFCCALLNAHSHTSALVCPSATVAERAATYEIRHNWSIQSCRRIKCMRKSGGSPHPNHLSACNKARGHSCTHNPQSLSRLHRLHQANSYGQFFVHIVASMVALLRTWLMLCCRSASQMR